MKFSWLADALQVARARILAYAVSGLAPAGPELRRRPVEIAFDGRPGVVITAALSVRELGFSSTSSLAVPASTSSTAP